MRFRPKYLFAATEATYGAPEALAAANAIRTTGLESVHYDGSSVSRDLDDKDFGNESQVNTNPHTTLSFGVEIAGAGAAGDVPAFGPLLRACGLSETVDPGVDVVYAIERVGLKSVTGLFARPDGTGTQQQHQSAGMRGNLAIEIANGRIPLLKFDNFKGSFSLPTGGAGAITPDWASWEDPQPVTNTNTPTATIDGFNVCLESLNFNLGNQVERVNAPGCAETMITDVLPTLSAVIKAPAMSEKDYWSKLVNHAGTIHDDIPVVFEHGSAAGGKLQLDVTHCQLVSVREQELRKELAYQLELAPISGIAITIK